MAQRPGYSSPGAAQTNYALHNFRQEDVVSALMTQLREKDAQISILTNQRVLLVQQKQIAEQTAQQCKYKIGQHNKVVAEKDTKIAILQQKLAQNGSVIAEANINHLTETNADYKRRMQERDNELAHLRPLLNEMKSKIEEYSNKDSIQYSKQLEDKLTKLEEELVAAKDQNSQANNTIDQLENKVKSKEWMIKTLQETNDDQRSLETRLKAQIIQLNEQVETYETKFNGKGVDVPMLLAKLKDYEVRTKDLQGQIRRLTNKKLNELVLTSRSSPVPNNQKDDDDKVKNPTPISRVSKQKLQQQVECEGDESLTSENSSFLVQSLEEEDETLGSNGTDNYDGYDDEEPSFSNNSVQEDEDAVSDFFTDVKVGIETLELESWKACCAQRQDSLSRYQSPLAKHENVRGSGGRYQGPRSPESM